MLSSLRVSARSVSTPVADRVLASLYLIVGCMLVYLVMFDQGAVLDLLIGTAAAQQNYLHEFFHDGRHLYGTPCH